MEITFRTTTEASRSSMYILLLFKTCQFFFVVLKSSFPVCCMLWFWFDSCCWVSLPLYNLIGRVMYQVLAPIDKYYGLSHKWFVCVCILAQVCYTVPVLTVTAAYRVVYLAFSFMLARMCHVGQLWMCAHKDFTVNWILKIEDFRPKLGFLL
jgi:hypothetical protein